MHPSTVSAPAGPLVEADGLCKRYGRREAVTRLSLTVQAGQVCALLGPNGAGKTSAMRMLAGLSRPDEGSVHLLGEPVSLGARVLRHVGVLIDGPAFVPHMTGLRNLRLLWSAAGREWPPPALDDALDLAGLGNAIDRRVAGYSMGMKQRLTLAQAVMRAPSVLILDEPTNGLDPAEVRALRQRLRALAKDGAAVLVSSHQLAEVQQLATHAIIMNRGRLIAAGPLDGLLGDSGAYRLEVDNPAAAAEVLRGLPGVTAVSTRGVGVTATAPGIPSRDLVHALVTAGVGISVVQQANLSLEETFLAMTEGNDEHDAR